MAKFSKRTRSDWMIGPHPVYSYKTRVPDPAVKRNRRKANDIRRMISKALNRVKNEGRTVYLRSDTYKGQKRPRTLYRIQLFEEDFYVLCTDFRVITLFTADMIESDARRGGLEFHNEEPFEELAPYYQ